MARPYYTLRRVVLVSTLFSLLSCVFAHASVAAAVASPSLDSSFDCRTDIPSLFDSLRCTFDTRVFDTNTWFWSQFSSGPMVSSCDTVDPRQRSEEQSATTTHLWQQITQWRNQELNQQLLCSFDGIPKDRHTLATLIVFMSEFGMSSDEFLSHLTRLVRLRSSSGGRSSSQPDIFLLTEVCGIDVTSIHLFPTIDSTPGGLTCLLGLLEPAIRHQLITAFDLLAYTRRRTAEANSTMHQLTWSDFIELDTALSLAWQDHAFHYLTGLDAIAMKEAKFRQLYLDTLAFALRIDQQIGDAMGRSKQSLDIGARSRLLRDIILRSLFHPETTFQAQMAESKRMLRAEYIRQELTYIAAIGGDSYTSVLPVDLNGADPVQRFRSHRLMGASRMAEADIARHVRRDFDTDSDTSSSSSTTTTTTSALLTVDVELLREQYATFQTLSQWLISMLTLSIGAAGVRHFPLATDAEINGFLNAYNLHAPIGHDLSMEFEDVLIVQRLEYETFQKFFLWIEIPNILYSARDESFTKLNRFNIHRMVQRMKSTYLEDLNFINFKDLEGPDAEQDTNVETPVGELQRMILLKWKLEHVNEILETNELNKHMVSLKTLRNRLNSSETSLAFRKSLTPGVLQYYYSTFLEHVAHFRLNYVCESSIYLFDSDFMTTWFEASSGRTFPTPLTVEALNREGEDGEASIAQLLQQAFTKAIGMDATKTGLLNRTHASLDLIEEDYTRALISKVVQDAIVRTTAATATTETTMDNAPTTEQVQADVGHGATRFHSLNVDESVDAAIMRDVTTQLAGVAMPDACTASSIPVTVSAACSAFRLLRTPVSHRRHIESIVRHVQQTMKEVKVDMSTFANTIATHTNTATLIDASANVTSKHYDRILPSDSYDHATFKRVQLIVERTLEMQTKMLEIWMLRDANQQSQTSTDLASITSSAQAAAIDALVRLYALATKSVELSIPAHIMSQWSDWMLVLTRVHPAATSAPEFVSPASSGGSIWSCARVGWSAISQTAFETLGVFHRGLTPAPHAALPLEYRQPHFQLLDADSAGTITDVTDGGATDTTTGNTATITSDTIFSTVSLHRFLVRLQLQSILDACHISNVDFRSDDFLRLVIEDPQVNGHLSSLQVLVERLQIRESDNAKAFALDQPKSWHSDRTKSPSASYDFTISTSYLDLLVYLDTLCFAPLGHLYLQQIANYHDGQILLITRKINAGDKDLLENRYRELIALRVWLADTNDFEKWRWSWPQDGSNLKASKSMAKYAGAIDLISSDSIRTVANSWTDLGVTSNISLAAVIAVIATVAFTFVEVIRIAIVKPWQRPSLILNGTLEHEEAYHREYERREKRIVLRRNLPLKIVLNLCTNFLLCTFSLTLNWSYFSPVAIFLYVCIFGWLTQIIIDVYLLKYFIYLTSLFLMPYVDFALKPPICACCIPIEKSMLVLNPLRPASEEQLRNVVSKNVDLLWGANNRNVISVLILQCVGNQTSTYRAYERIIRDMLYDHTEVPSHVKDRFFIFQMGGISKPHNMYKVFRWMFGALEEHDPVTKNFLYGIQTEWKLEEHPRMIRRAPEGEQLPLFLQAGEGTKIQVEVEATTNIQTTTTTKETKRTTFDATTHTNERKEAEEDDDTDDEDDAKKASASTVNQSTTSPVAPNGGNSKSDPISPFTQASAEVSALHCDSAQMKEFASRTYEPLVYLGGAANCYKGIHGQGADAGIIGTEGGIRVLERLRNESHPGQPLLENFLVLDADNYVEPVTLLRMINTMNDSYLIWQPSINFYNSTQSMYAYVKNYANMHLGNIMNTSNTLMLGGVRSFGKYFGRVKRYYYEECTASSAKTSASHYPILYSLCAYLLCFTIIAVLVRPIYWEVTTILLFVTPVTLILTVALTLWSHNLKPDEVELISSRYQSMFPLNRMFIQSEDARHGGPFGRAAFIMDDQIHEATPPSPIDDSRRENSKWLPTFDMRDWILLHTPLLWVLTNLRLSLFISAGCCAVSLIFTIISWNLYADGFMQCTLALSCCISGILFLMILSLYRVATKETLYLVSKTRLPEMPERAEYAEALVSRGVFGEGIWAVQFLLGLAALLFPGTVEVAFPFLGESHLLFIIILLVHPKFSGAFLTRMHRLLRPRYQGFWKMMPESAAGTEKKGRAKMRRKRNAVGDAATVAAGNAKIAINGVEMAKLSQHPSKDNDSDATTSGSDVDPDNATFEYEDGTASDEYIHTTLFVDPHNPRDLYCGSTIIPQIHGTSVDGDGDDDNARGSIWCCFRRRWSALPDPILTMPNSPSHASKAGGVAPVDTTPNEPKRKIQPNTNTPSDVLPGHVRNATNSQLLSDGVAAMHASNELPPIESKHNDDDDDDDDVHIYDRGDTITVTRALSPRGNPLVIRSNSVSKTPRFVNRAQVQRTGDEPSRVQYHLDTPMSRMRPSTHIPPLSHANSGMAGLTSIVPGPSASASAANVASAFPNPFSNFYAEQRAILAQQQHAGNTIAFTPSVYSRKLGSVVATNAYDDANGDEKESIAVGASAAPRLKITPVPHSGDVITPFTPVSSSVPPPVVSGEPWVVRVDATPSHHQHQLGFDEGDSTFFGDTEQQMAEYDVEETPRATDHTQTGTSAGTHARNASTAGLWNALRNMDSEAIQRRHGFSSEDNSPQIPTVPVRRPSGATVDGSHSDAESVGVVSRRHSADLGRPPRSGVSSRDGSPFVPIRPRLAVHPAVSVSAGASPIRTVMDGSGRPMKLITLTPPGPRRPTLLRPLTQSGTTVLQSQAEYHTAMIAQKARMVGRRKYIVQRERRKDLFRELILGWFFHDLPVGFFEFAASTSVFLVKIISKPFHVLWAFLGVYLEIRGLLGAVPVAGTWPSFVESEETLPLSAYIDEYAVPMATGVGVLILCLPSLTSNIMQIPGFQHYLFSETGLLLLSCFFALVLGVYPAMKQLQQIKYALRKPNEIHVDGIEQPWYTHYEWHRITNFSTFRMILVLGTSCGIAVALVLIGFLTYSLAGMIPVVFFIRSFPILVSSFIFGPAVGFLVGKVNGTIDGATNPPTCRDSQWTRRLVIGMGWGVAILSVYFVYFFSQMLLPGAAMGMHGPNTPTGDGSMSAMLPFTLSYNEMLKAPWYFVIPYASIVYGGLFIGVIAWAFGIGHQIWTSYREYQAERAFKIEMHAAAVEAAERMAHAKVVDAITDAVTPQLAIRMTPDRAHVTRNIDLPSTVHESQSHSDTTSSESSQFRVSPRSRPLALPSAGSPLIKLESPYLSLEHMRIKEAQYRQELEEAEEAAFTPQLFNRPRLQTDMDVQNDGEIIPVMHHQPINSDAEHNGPSSILHGRSPAWVARELPTPSASTVGISEFLSQFSPAHGRYTSPLGMSRHLTVPAAHGGGISSPRHGGVPSYLTSTPKHARADIDGADDPHHASNNRTRPSAIRVPSSRHSVRRVVGPSSSSEHAALTDDYMPSPEVAQPVSASSAARLHQLGQSLKNVFGDGPSSAPNTAKVQVSRVGDSEPLTPIIPTLVKSTSSGSSLHPRPIQDPSAGLFARGVAMQPQPILLDRAVTTTAAIARNKGGFDYTLDTASRPSKRNLTIRKAPVLTGGAGPNTNALPIASPGLLRAESASASPYPAPAPKPARSTRQSRHEPDTPPPAYTSRPATAAMGPLSPMRGADVDSTPEVSQTRPPLTYRSAVSEGYLGGVPSLQIGTRTYSRPDSLPGTADLDRARRETFDSDGDGDSEEETEPLSARKPPKKQPTLF